MCKNIYVTIIFLELPNSIQIWPIIIPINFKQEVLKKKKTLKKVVV